MPPARFATSSDTAGRSCNLTDDILVFTQAALEDRIRRPGRRSPSTAPCSPTPARGARSPSTRSRRPGPAPGSRRASSARGMGREFVGFNRACHAVLEASILASRVRRLPAEEIRAELGRLTVLVDKTAGPREREAMSCVLAHMRAASGDA